MVPFEYPPLDDFTREIRLLTLVQGGFSSEIRVLIANTSLTDEDSPVYEALSYTWGSPEDQVDISVGEIPGVATIAVSQNLAQALPYLRYEDKPRLLWIDAICINQDDLQERSRQAARMGDIYRSASRVIAWLGPGDEDTNYGIRLLDNLSCKIQVSWVDDTIEPANLEAVTADWADLIKPLSWGREEIFAITKFFDRPWFERLWTWGELWSANGKATLMCGSLLLPLSNLRAAVWWLNRKAFGTAALASGKRLPFHDRLKLIYEVCDEALPDRFERFLNKARSRQCSDPRDRVYAIVCTFRGPGRLPFLPDYSKTTREVYTDVVTWYYNYYHTLNILTECEMREGPRVMPTWIPDWSREHDAVDFLPPGQASADTPAWVMFDEPGVLLVKLIQSATIVYTDNIRIDKGTFHELRREIRRLAPQNISRRLYKDGRRMRDVFCEALVCGSWSENYHPPDRALPFREPSEDVLPQLLQSEDDTDIAPSSPARRFLQQFYTLGRKRTFIVTEEGHIGLAPRITRTGDRICVIAGCHTPMVIRPCINCENFHVIGKCYVPGLMNGEAVLGPLPSNMRPVFHFDEELQQWDRAFIKRPTGVIQRSDPRLGTLAFADPSGEKRKEIDPKALEERGVKLTIVGLE